MIHKCPYADLIGASPKWIADSGDGREVCMYCSEPKEVPKPPAPKPVAKTVRK